MNHLSVPLCVVLTLSFVSRDKLAYEPFAKKLEAMSEDADINSLLGSRCCRNERGEPVEMASSYPWLTSMTTATGKDDMKALKDTMGPNPKAGTSICLHNLF